MSASIIAFFNNKGGVGKTSLVYHLAWMYSDLGLRVVAADLDPQANLTAAFLDEDTLERLWCAGDPGKTIYSGLVPLIRGVADVVSPSPKLIEDSDSLALIVGDLRLSSFEGQLSDAWPRCLDRDERAFRVMSAFWRVLRRAAGEFEADVVLMDLGPNLGAINRSALIAADHIVVPLCPDLFSLQGLRNLGPTLRQWREEWRDRIDRYSAPDDLPLPAGRMAPAGYVVQQHSIRLDRPTRSYDKWIVRIPGVYRQDVLDEPADSVLTPQQDQNCIALLKHYRSLMPLAQESRKPIFHLKSADGALGAHQQGVRDARQDFEQLARQIAARTGVTVPELPVAA